MTKKKTLEQLQEEHSEMLATAADLGMTVPVDLTADFASAETGGTVCSNLDALIRKFREGLDQEKTPVEGTENEVAADEARSDDARVRSPRKTAAKKPKTTKNSAAPAEDKSGEEQVAKTAKKTAAKKPAKKAAKPAAKKATVAKKAKAAGGTRFAEDATIKWGAGKKNPAREGKGRHERIEKVIKSSGKTVKAFVASGGNPTTLRNCVNAKLCTVA